MKILKLKKNFKRLVLLFFFLVLLIIFLKYPKNYVVKYNIKNIDIKEQYIKENKQYLFKINYKKQLYEYTIKHNYYGKKKLIKSLKLENSCLTPILKKGKLYTLCYDSNKKLFAYKNKNLKYKTKKVKQITFNPSKKIYIWNHKGYTLLNTNKKINLFKKEIYYNNLAYKTDNYLITPDYEKKNRFTTFYVINLENSRLTKIKSKYKISYDYYYLGTIKNNVYIVDKRTKKEYSINLKKKKVSLITNKNDDGKIWDGSWKDISMVKLSSKEKKFNQINIYNYKLKNNLLYTSYNLCSSKIQVSNKKIDNILYENNEEIYYLIKNKVYLSTPFYKDIFILEYDELEFNSDNQVFLS